MQEAAPAACSLLLLQYDEDDGCCYLLQDGRRQYVDTWLLSPGGKWTFCYLQLEAPLQAAVQAAGITASSLQYDDRVGRRRTAGGDWDVARLVKDAQTECDFKMIYCLKVRR